MKEYTITLPDGIETTVLLSDEDAKARGLTAAASSKAKQPANKQASPANKAGVSAKQAEAASEAFGKG